MTNSLSTLVGLGPLQGPLAAISKLTRSHAVEKAVLQWLGRPYVRTRYGVKMRSNWSDVTFYLCCFGFYGRTLSDLLEGQKSPFLFLDIGANQGLYSLIAGKNPHCRTAIAFEPVPATFALLEANVAANGLGQVVKPANVAIASQDGDVVMRIGTNHSGSATMASANPTEGEEVTIHTIGFQSLDKLIPDGPEDIVVKIDVEGFEPVVIAELARSRHAGRMKTLFYEVSETLVDPGKIERQLRAMGLTGFRKISHDPAATHYDVLATR